MQTLTPDGILVLAALVIGVLCVFLWIFWKSRANGGIAELPSFLLFGWGGAAWAPDLIVIDKNYKNKAALIAHERVHQEQQRRDGVLAFWLLYLTSKTARQDYEIEAYKAWLAVTPGDLEKVIWWLLNSYNVSSSREEIIELLKDV